MPQVTSYPVFEPDQVLTDTHLNNLFAYLDQQERLTRNKLLGIGIVCGLHISVEENTITVSKGVGLTSLGYLLQFEGGSFTAFRPYTVPDFPETIDPAVHAFYATWSAQLLIADEKKETNDKLLKDNADLLKSNVVVLFLEPQLTDLKNCTTEDCNDKGKRVDITIRPLLVAKEVLQRYKYFNLQQQKFSFPQVHLKRWNVPSQQIQHPANVVQAFDAVLSSALLNEVAVACKFVFDLFDPLLNNEDTDVPGDVYGYLLKLQQSVRQSRPVYYQYIYDYVDDIIKAYNEFAAVVFDVLSECCPDENLFPLHLMLGEADRPSVSSNTAFRNYFIYSPLFDRQKDGLERARMYYRRLLLLLSEFDLAATTLSVAINTAVLTNAVRNVVPIRITPSYLGAYSLGRRCIPYYYNPKELFTVWDHEKSRRGKAAMNYSYHADVYSNDPATLQPLLYDIEPYNFFRIEGHVGVEVNSALQNIVLQRKQYNLPFDVAALNLYPGQTLSEADKLKCYFSDLESQYNVLVAEMLCKLHGLYCDAGKWPFNKQIFDSIFRGANNLNTNAFKAAGDIFARATTDAAASGEGATDINIGDIVKDRNLARTFEESLQVISLAAVNFVDRTRHINPYQKGTYMRYFCKPDPKAETVANYYLNWLKANDGKRWPKPPATVPANNPQQWLVVYYFHLFYLIDTVEELLRTILPFDLNAINYNKFKIAYDEVIEEVDAFADYFDNFYHGLDILNDQKDIAADKPFNLIQEEVESWIIEKAVVKVFADSRGLRMMCIDDRLQQLLFEYRKRVSYVLNQHIFSQYAQLKTGLEHKAGVPKGGTFVMLYFDKPAITRNVTDRNLAAATLATDVSSATTAATTTAETAGAATNLQAAKTKLTDAEKLERNVSSIETVVERNKAEFEQQELTLITSLLAQIRKLPPSAETLRIPEGVVFADLYIPYMCCSECAPTAFVYQDKVEETPQPDISIKRTFFCNNEDVKEPVTVSPEGGTVTGQGVIHEGDQWFFNPKGLAEDNYVLQYKIGTKTDTVNVTVKAVYDPAFTYQEKGPDATGAGVVVVFTAASQQGQHTWDFGDNTTASNDVNPQHLYQLVGGEARFEVTHTVTNGNCTLPPVKQTISLVRQNPIQISIDRSPLCTNDGPQAINFSPAGGVMICKENGQAVVPTNNGFSFVPQVSGAGQFTVNYQLGGQSKDLSVKVVEAPSAEFDSKLIEVTKETRTFQFTSSSAGENHHWEFSDGQTADVANPKIQFKLDGQTEGVIKVTHFVKGAVCGSEVVKEVSLQLPVKESSQELCFTTDPISLEPNAGGNASVIPLDAGGHQLDEKGNLRLSDQTKTGVTRFLVSYIVNSPDGAVEKHVKVTVNRLSEDVRLTANQDQIQLEVKAKAVSWTISVNNGQTRVIKTSSDNPLRLRIGPEVPRVVEIAFIISAEITDGTCKDRFTKVLPAQKYNEFIRSGGELVL